MSSLTYIELESQKISHLLNGELILIVTATELETNATHQKLKPLNGFDKIIKVFEDKRTYYFGMLGQYKVSHVQCSMGSMSRDSSIMTVSTAVNMLKAKIVVMIGIAFGVDESKQNVDDVFVSESVIPYNAKRVGKTKTIHRGIEAQSSQVLLNRFKNIRTWEHFINTDVKAN